MEESKKKLTPAQRREARRLADQEVAAEKSARLRERVVAEASPRVYALPPDEVKSPRARENPGSIMSSQVSICHQTKADIDGQWSWGLLRQWTEGDWNTHIEPKIAQFQRLTWAEVHAQNSGRHSAHHNMDICDLIPEAFERWCAIGLDEFETTFRFRLQNKQRLWGVRVHANFYVVWWDPEHQLYPVNIADN